MGKHSKNTINIKSRKKDKNKIDKKPIERNMSEKELKKSSKKQKKDAKKNSKLRKKIKKIIIFIILISILIFAVVKGISMYKWQTIAKEMISNTNSIIVDKDGNTIATLGSEKIHKNISFSEMPSNLKNAYVAIEDERFYKHHGVDVKRTGSAIVSYIIHFGSSSFGGSSITQQLVKNITGNDASSISRKVDEWSKAVELEFCLSKEEILESYLNIIYVGPNIYGVEMGAKYYFNKSAKDLKLEECAYLAGLNHSPNSYNPFGDTDREDKIKKRTKLVLNKMLELEYISDEDYNQAVSNVEKGLNFKKGNLSPENDAIYSYHTDAVISEVISDISKEKKLDTTFATNYLNRAGLTIYSTVDSKIQKQMEEEFEKSKHIIKSKNDTSATSQAAMVIIDHTRGYVVGCVGGLGKKTTSRGFNRATQGIRQTGSSSKPLTVLVPGIDKKIFTASTIFDDKQTSFIDRKKENYSPTNNSGYLGKITVRRAVESSQNIPFVEMMEKITPSTSIKYLEKMGITTLTEEDNNLALALGGLDKGISPLEMAGAYSTLANDRSIYRTNFLHKDYK